MHDWAAKVVEYPDHLKTRYRAAGLWGSRTIAQELDAVASSAGDRPAVIAEEGALSHRELKDVTDRLALGLLKLGLRPGDRIIVQLTNRVHSVVAWYGMVKAGLVPVCTLAAHRAHEIGAISRKVGAVGHLVESAASAFDPIAFAGEIQHGHPTLRQILTAGAEPGSTGARIEDLIEATDADIARSAVAEVQRGTDPDDVVCLQLSGGTTGVPKIIPRLHAEYWYNARAYAESGGWHGETRVAHLIPIIHNAGITCALHAVHSVGGTLVLATPVLDQALPLLAEARATDALIGHGHFSMVDHPDFAHAMTAMRRVLLSGAKVPPRVFAAFEDHGVWVGQTFGMGEGFFTVSPSASSRTSRLATVGVPMSPLDEFRVLQPGTEAELADGEVGELVCRGPYTIRGYYDAPDINASAFTSDGFYRTGDLVKVHAADGQRALSVEGRIKDLINRGGEKISAEEVEGLLVQHPAIAAAAVVAMPDERLGERACAYLVARGEALALDDVRAHLQSLQLAKFKWPERLEWVPGLPRTAVGKVDKKRLQLDVATKLAAARADQNPAGAPAGVPPVPPTEQVPIEMSPKGMPA